MSIKYPLTRSLRRWIANTKYRRSIIRDSEYIWRGINDVYVHELHQIIFEIMMRKRLIQKRLST